MPAKVSSSGAAGESGARRFDAVPAVGPFLYAERVIADPRQKRREESAAAHRTWKTAPPRDRKGSAGLVTVLLVACGATAGLCAGLSFAALGLATAGRTLMDISATRIQVFLVAGPLLGLIPMAILCLAATRSPDVASRMPVTLALWFFVMCTATAWFGVRPLLS